MRLAGSTGANPYAAISAGVSALWGPAHGGANEAVLAMLEQIGTVDNIPKYLGDGQGQVEPLPAHGLRPPRLQELRPARQDHPRDVPQGARASLGRADNPLFELALRLEEIALKDEYFVSRKLYPNVDFYSGIIYSAIGIPRSMFTVMFAIARTVGWVAHWQEMIADPAHAHRPPAAALHRTDAPGLHGDRQARLRGGRPHSAFCTCSPRARLSL